MNAVTFAALIIMTIGILATTGIITRRVLNNPSAGRGLKIVTVAAASAIVLMILAVLIDTSGSKIPHISGPMADLPKQSIEADKSPAIDPPVLAPSVSADERLRQELDKLNSHVEYLIERRGAAE